jgi:hypothetical protein
MLAHQTERTIMMEIEVHFGVTCLEFSDNVIKVVYADQFDRSKTSNNDNENMVSKIMEIKNSVGNVTCINIDGANAEFIYQENED